MEYVIGVDIGTQSTKALLADRTGRIVAQHSIGYRVDTPRPLWAEQWPQVWLDAVLGSLRECVQAAGVAADEVRALCISGLYGGAGIPVNAQCTPLYPCLIWMDRRAGAQSDAVRAAIDPDWLQRTTGNGVDSYYGYTKMLWLREHRPDIWRQTRWFVPPNAWVIHALTGELAVDHSAAGNIGGVYDVARRQWSRAALEKLGIPVQMMPERLVESNAIVGGLNASRAAQIGLLAGTPVIAGGVDAAVATLAAGGTRPGRHVAMIGTSMCWGYISTESGGEPGMISMPHVHRGLQQMYVFGGAITAGASVSWFRHQIGHDASEEQLESLARHLPAGSDGVVFLPYLMGERSPIWDARASGAFVGLSLFHTTAHLYRAVLEGVAFALRHNIVESGQQKVLDARLILVGGASKSDLWSQIIADVTGYPVYTIREDVECALGAALLAAHGVGLIDDAVLADGWGTLVERAQPLLAAQARYSEQFEIYRSLYPALRASMHALGVSARFDGDSVTVPPAAAAPSASGSL